MASQFEFFRDRENPYLAMIRLVLDRTGVNSSRIFSKRCRNDEWRE
jgi:hypothetical protein